MSHPDTKHRFQLQQTFQYQQQNIIMKTKNRKADSIIYYNTINLVAGQCPIRSRGVSRVRCALWEPKITAPVGLVSEEIGLPCFLIESTTPGQKQSVSTC